MDDDEPMTASVIVRSCISRHAWRVLVSVHQRARMVRAAIVCTFLFALCRPVAAQSVPVAGSASQPGAQTSRDETSLGSIFRELGGDFRDLPSLETAAILGVGG